MNRRDVLKAGAVSSLVPFFGMGEPKDENPGLFWAKFNEEGLLINSGELVIDKWENGRYETNIWIDKKDSIHCYRCLFWGEVKITLSLYDDNSISYDFYATKQSKKKIITAAWGRLDDSSRLPLKG